MLELSSEETLRLNVLINNVEAIRIEERTLTVFGLSARGEARVQLNPTGRSDQYLRAVREFLSSCALGSRAAIRYTSIAGRAWVRRAIRTLPSC